MSKDGICRDGKPCPKAPHRNGYPDMTACARNGVCQRVKMDALPMLTVEHLGGNRYRLETREPEAPRSPTQPDAVELLRQLVKCKTRMDYLSSLDLPGLTELYDSDVKLTAAWSAARAFLRGGSGG